LAIVSASFAADERPDHVDSQPRDVITRAKPARP
jgi:hypothetical protein